MKELSIVVLLVVLCSGVVDAQKKVFDHHVHIMSPRMIKLFKDVNIPFSKPDADYSDWNSITKRLGTNKLKLISMAYLYGHPEFGKVENEYESVKAENDYLLEAKKKSPKTIRAFCGINPLRDYALDEAERCRKILKADGIKLHFNASQVYLTVPDHVRKVFPIFEFAAKNKLPVVLHFDNSHRKFGETDVKLLADEILAKIKPLNLQIAHFGTSGGFNQRTKGVIDAFLKQFETDPDMKRHKITFDISAVALDKDSEGVPKLTDELFAELAAYVRRLTPRRVVFGTDYPLYSVDEYLEILRKRVKLTDSEISSFRN
jgi:predicted TIM-barrel fold metal-dependent hydrolase